MVALKQAQAGKGRLKLNVRARIELTELARAAQLQLQHVFHVIDVSSKIQTTSQSIFQCTTTCYPQEVEAELSKRRSSSPSVDFAQFNMAPKKIGNAPAKAKGEYSQSEATSQLDASQSQDIDVNELKAALDQHKQQVRRCSRRCHHDTLRC